MIYFLNLNKYYLLVFSVAFFGYRSLLANSIRITGKIADKKVDFILVAKLFNYDISYEYDTIKIENHSFELSFDDKVPFMLSFRFHTKESSNYDLLTLFITDAEEEITISLDYKNSDYPIFDFAGNNALGHKLFYEFESSPLIIYLHEIEKSIEDNDDIHAIINKINLGIEKLIYPFKQLIEDKEINETYFLVATQFIKSSILSSIIGDLLDKETIIYSKIDNNQDKYFVVEKLLELCPKLEDVYLLAGKQLGIAASHQFKVEFVRHYSVDSYPFVSDTTITFNDREYILNDVFPIFFLIEDEKYKEIYFAYWLHFFYKTMQGMNFMYDEKLAYFEAIYPNSFYLPVIKKARSNNKMILNFDSYQDLEPSILLKKYYDTWKPVVISSFENINEFPFKSLEIDISKGIFYVDVWATWCYPCLKEMTYNHKVDSLLDANNIKRLYVSIDEEYEFIKWENLIFKLHLGGFHILSNEKLRLYLSKELYVEQSMNLMIPRYFFIKDGIIVEMFAAKPSSIQKLENQIQNLIQK